MKYQKRKETLKTWIIWAKTAHVHKYNIHYNFCDFSKIIILLYAKRPKWGEISKSLPSYFHCLRRVIEFIF